MGAVFGLATALCIGVTDVFARRVIAASNPGTTATVLQILGAATAVVVAVAVGGELVPTDLALGSASGVGLAVGLGCYYRGISASSATVVAPVVGTMSATLPFLYAVATGQGLAVAGLVGAAIALAGLVVINADIATVPEVGPGVRWAVVSGIGYAVALTLVIEISDDSGAWPVVPQRLVAFAALSVMATALGVPILPPRATLRPSLLAGAFVGASTIFYLFGVRIDAPRAVVTSSVFPAFAVLTGWMAFGDPLGRRHALGLVVVVVGVGLVVGG